MSKQAHIGQILPLVNQPRPLSVNTSLHASYDTSLWGYSPTGAVKHIGYTYAYSPNATSYILTGLLAGSSGTNSTYTIEAWVKPSSIGTAQAVFGAQSASPFLFYVGLEGGNWTLGVQGSAGTDASKPAVTAATATWTHLALVLNGSGTTSLYVNGVLSYSKTSNGYNLQGQLEIGGALNSGVAGFSGAINEVRLWTVARTQAQLIGSMYGELNGDESGLLSYWKLNDNDSGLARNSAYTGSDGYYSGTPAWTQGMTVASLNTGKFDGAVAVEEATTNLVVNGNFENGMANWGCLGSGTTASISNISYSGSQSIRIVPGGLSGTGVIQSFSITPGDIVSLSARVYLKSITAGEFNVDVLGGSLDSNGIIMSTGTTTSGFVYYKQENIVIPSDATTLYVRAFFDGTSPQGEAYVDEIQVEKKSFATSFVNGSRPDPALKYPVMGVLSDNAGTISFWAKHTTSPANWSVSSQTGFYFHSNEATTNPTFAQMKNALALTRINRSATTLSLVLTDSSSNMFQKDMSIASDTNWHHYAITWDKSASQVTFYYDGVQQFSQTPTYWFTTFQNTPYFCIGSSYVESGLPGCASLLMDELRIDTVAVGADEILSWYYANSPFIPHQSSLEVY